MSSLARYDYNDSATKLLLPQRDWYFKQSDAARNNRVVFPTGKPYFSPRPPVATLPASQDGRAFSNSKGIKP